MQRNPQTAPTFSRRWTLAAIAAASVAIAGAALAWHGHAHAQGPGHGHHMHGGWEQMDPEVMGRRIEAMTALRLAEIDATPEQKSRIAAIMKAGRTICRRCEGKDARCGASRCSCWPRRRSTVPSSRRCARSRFNGMKQRRAACCRHAPTRPRC